MDADAELLKRVVETKDFFQTVLYNASLDDWNAVKAGQVGGPEEWRWSSYNNSALDQATVVACPIQIDYVRLPEGYRA